MATKLTGQVNVGSTATLLFAANANLRVLAMRVQNGEAWVGASNAVTVKNGFHLQTKDAPLVDNIPSVDDWYAIKRAGGPPTTISYLAIVD